LSEISHLDFVLAQKPEMLKSMRPITGDMVVAFELERLGIDFIDEWDFLQPDEIEKSKETAHVLSKTWWDENLASTSYEGFSLTHVAQQDLVYPFEACLNARVVYERIFKAHPISKVSGYFLPPVGVVRTGPAPTTRAVSSVAQAILFYIAERQGIPVDKLHSPLPLTAIVQGFRGYSVSGKNATKFAETSNMVGKTILVYESGMPTSENVMLTRAINQMAGVRMISISHRLLNLSEQFKMSSPKAAGRFQFFWEKFLEFTRVYKGEYPEIFANPHLLFQFECIKSEMEMAAIYGDTFYTFLEVANPALVIFGHEAFTIERVLVCLAQSRKIPTIGMVHGGLGCRFGHQGIVGDADVITVWSDVDIEQLVSFGVNEARLHKIGGIRYAENYAQYIGKHDISSPEPKRAAKARLGVNQTKPLIALLTAQINTGLVSALANPRLHREAIRGLLALIDARPDLQFIIKAHPSYDYFELYRRLLDAKRPNLMFFEQAKLDEVLEASDICLMINYCTTAALEAMLLKVPVIYLNNAVYPLKDWQDNLTEISANRVTTVVELERSIDKLLTSPAAKKIALDEADKQIIKTLDIQEISASNRMLELIKQLIDDQKAVKTNEVSIAQKMREMLALNDASVSQQDAAITSRQSPENLMCILAHLAGVCNLELASLRRIYEIFGKQVKHESLKTWGTAKWSLLEIYLAGYFGETGNGRAHLASIKVFLPYVLNPHQYIAAPDHVRRYVGKFFILSFFGKKAFLWARAVRN